MEISDTELRLLNFYRASELHGGLILGQLVRRTRGGELLTHLTRHSAEEVHHALLWTETIVAVGGQPTPTADTWQARFAALGGPMTSLCEVLALTQVFERRVYRHFTAHLRRGGTHPHVQATLRRMLEEEKYHLSWVARWLKEQEVRRGALVPKMMKRYEGFDRTIYQQLLVDYEWRAAA